MAFRIDKRAFLILRMQRNRRRRDATLNPIHGVLGFVTNLPQNGELNTDYVTTWQNGLAPYVVQVFKDRELVSQTQSDLETYTINKSTSGRYDLKIISSDGQILTATIFIN